MRMVSPTRTDPARSAPRPVLLPVRGAVRGVTSPGLRPERDRELVGARQLLEVTESKMRSEEHTSELQSLAYLVCRLLLEKKNSRMSSMNRMSVHDYSGVS